MKHTQPMNPLHKVTWLILAILLTMSCNAASPFKVTSASSVGTLNIVSPQFDAIQKDSSFKLQFHVLNSTGFLLKGTQATCSIHVYNKSGSHILLQNVTINSNNVDFEVLMNSTFTSQLGYYTYNFFCNSTNEGGFVESAYLVTNDGHDRVESGTTMPMIIFILGVVALLFWFGSMMQQNTEWEQGIKLLVNMVGLALLIVGSAYLLVTLWVYNISDNLYSIISMQHIVLMIILLALIGLFLWFFIIKLIDYMRKLKRPDF